MFDYDSEEGLLYAAKLLNGFVNSDFYDGEETKELVLNEIELKKIINKKAFKDYLVQRERDYSEVASFLVEISYQYDEGFSSTLDINAGKFDASSLFDNYYNTESSILTPYCEESFFDEETNLYNGSIELLKVFQGDKTLMVPYIKGEGVLPQLSDFDTIIYLNDIEVYRLLSLYRYAIEKRKKFIGGIVTNVYDKNAISKLKQMDEIIVSLNEVLGNTVLKQDLRSNGSVIKLIHTLE